MQVSIRKIYGKKINEVKPSPSFWLPGSDKANHPFGWHPAQKRKRA